MLRWRLLGSAAILIPLAATVYADYAWNFGIPGIWLFPLTVLFIALATEEMLSLLSEQEHRPRAWVVYAGVLWVVLVSCAPFYYALAGKIYPPNCPLGRLGLTFAAFVLTIPLVFIGEMLRYEKPGGVIVRVALALWAIAYLAVPYSFLIWLRYLDDVNPKRGMAALISVILIVKMSDVGAYTCGRMWGRTKLTPLLSPGKTVEGAIGGIAFACLTSLAYFRFGVPLIAGAPATGSVGGWLFYGAILAVMGIVGDLAESLLKRDMGRKDSSRWLVGLGGILDIMDSVLLAAPIAYLCWVGRIV
jgi:phosphatidate cytidylyltransferase